MRRAISATAAALAAVGLGGCCDDSWLASLVGCTHLRVGVTADRSTAQPGERVNLTGTALNANDIAEIAWDYDGDGIADRIDLPATPPFTGPLYVPAMAHARYAKPGLYRPAFMLLTSDLERRASRTEVTVTARQPGSTPEPNRRPVAELMAPDTVRAGQEFQLGGSDSYDPDGTIVRYQWDFDNDGQVDADTGTSQFTMHTYDRPGRYTARLVVTDDEGATGAATHDIQATEGSPTSPGGPTAPSHAAAAPRRFRATLRGRSRGLIPPLRQSGPVSMRRGLRGGGRARVRLIGPRRPGDGALRRLLDGIWQTRLTASFDRSRLLGRMPGIALVRPARRGRRRELGCLSFSVQVAAFRRPRGTIRLLGGSGRYARLRVRGAFTPAIGGSAVKLSGTVRVRRATARVLPRGCRALRRSR
jgi:hypothetical protein